MPRRLVLDAAKGKPSETVVNALAAFGVSGASSARQSGFCLVMIFITCLPMWLVYFIWMCTAP